MEEDEDGLKGFLSCSLRNLQGITLSFLFLNFLLNLILKVHGIMVEFWGFSGGVIYKVLVFKYVVYNFMIYNGCMRVFGICGGKPHVLVVFMSLGCV